MPIRLALAATAALVAAGCASIQPARMAMPPSLAAAESMPITGIGGGQTGRFAVGDSTGSFSRSATRLAFFDALFEHRDGHTSFSLSDGAAAGLLTAECRMSERTVTLGIASFEAHPMAYGCTFRRDNRTIPARFELQARRAGLGGMLMQQERRGEMTFDGITLSIRSVHDLQGSALSMATPIGYVFERDGADIGAVEINGEPMIAFRPGTDEITRRAIIAAALALSLFWDPAESALGREAD